MASVRIDEAAFSEFARWKLPKLMAHFDSLQFPLGMFTVRWFLTLFTEYLSVDAVLRVFDILVNEDDRALFRIALGILKIAQKRVMAMHEQCEIMQFFKGGFDALGVTIDQ